MEPVRRIFRFFSLSREDRASVLIACLGILVALVLMGVTFTTLQRMESRGARNYLDSAQVSQVAEGVIRYTMERLRTGRTYIGAGNTSYLLGAAHNTYSPNPLNATFRTFYEFAYTDLPTGDAVTGFNTTTGKPLTATARCNVRVLDCSGQIYVGSPACGMNQAILQTVLASLMTQLGSPFNATTAPTIATDAFAIANGTFDTVAGGYKTKLEIQAALNIIAGNNLTLAKQKYDRIRDYLTVYGVPEPALEPDAALNTTSRVPVNVNTASREVLVALLTPVLSPAANLTSVFASINQTRPFRGWLTPPGANWTGFVDCIRSINATSLPIADRDRLLAHFVPNPLLRLANPSRYAQNITPGKDSTTDYIDTSHTTEFCLQSSGYYEILLNTSILGPPPDYSLLARRKHEAVVRTHELWKQTTQKDFATNSTLGNLTTYPENLAATGINASSRDGYVGFQPLNTNPGGSFYVSFSNSFGATCTPGSMSDTTPVTDPSNPGELAADGAIAWTSDDGYPQALRYDASNFNATIGSFGFWVKPLFTPAPGISQQILNLPFASDINPAVTLGVTVSIEGTNLNATYTYPSAVNATQTLACSIPLKSTPVNWTAGEWHHIGATYSATNASAAMFLFADNVPANASLPTTGFVGVLTPSGYARFGADDTVQVYKPTGTLDEIVYYRSISTNVCTDRYPAGNSTFTSGNYSVSSNTIIGAVSWTELMPRDGTAANVTANLTADIEVQIEVNGVPINNTFSEMQDGGGGYFLTAGNVLYRAALGSQIRYKAQFRPAQTVNLYPAPKIYGNLTQRVDTPFLDDITITLLPPPKVLYQREVFDE